MGSLLIYIFVYYIGSLVNAKKVADSTRKKVPKCMHFFVTALIIPTTIKMTIQCANSSHLSKQKTSS